MIKALLILSTSAFAQVHTGQSKTEIRVNDHMQKTNKKIEIEAQQKEVELKRDAPKNLKADPKPKKKDPFVVFPKEQPQDQNIYRDQYDHSVGKDPAMEFEQQVQEARDTPTAEEENAAYIRQFKENAAKAGVKVHVDPKTLKARPVQGSGTNN